MHPRYMFAALMFGLVIAGGLAAAHDAMAANSKLAIEVRSQASTGAVYVEVFEQGRLVRAVWLTNHQGIVPSPLVAPGTKVAVRATLNGQQVKIHFLAVKRPERVIISDVGGILRVKRA